MFLNKMPKKLTEFLVYRYKTSLIDPLLEGFGIISVLRTFSLKYKSILKKYQNFQESNESSVRLAKAKGNKETHTVRIMCNRQ